jgi:hypothetical protein
LLYFIFSQPIEKITQEEIEDMLNHEDNHEDKLSKISELSGLQVRSLRTAVTMTKYFDRQLSFTDSEQTIREIVEQELSSGKERARQTSE